MKKKVLIVVMMFAVFITNFLVSRTYAKYISKIDLTDEARVAHWGINITKDVDLFRDSYYFTNKDGEEEAYVKSLGCKNIINDNGESQEVCDNVIAPGTSGEYRFTISGTPEVNYRIKLKVLEKQDTVGRITYDLDGKCPTDDINELAWCIESLYSIDDVFPATRPTDTYHTISWKWDFYKNDLEDKKDTDKGSAAIIEENDLAYDKQAKVKLVVNVTAEQTKDAATK